MSSPDKHVRTPPSHTDTLASTRSDHLSNPRYTDLPNLPFLNENTGVLQHGRAAQHSCSFRTILPSLVLLLPFSSFSSQFLYCTRFDFPWKTVVKHLTSNPFPLSRNFTWCQRSKKDTGKLQWKMVQLISSWYTCSHTAVQSHVHHEEINWS